MCRKTLSKCERVYWDPFNQVWCWHLNWERWQLRVCVCGGEAAAVVAGGSGIGGTDERAGWRSKARK